MIIYILPRTIIIKRSVLLPKRTYISNRFMSCLLSVLSIYITWREMYLLLKKIITFLFLIKYNKYILSLIIDSSDSSTVCNQWYY